MSTSRVDLIRIVRERDPQQVQHDLLLYLLYKEKIDADLDAILLGKPLMSDEEVEIHDLAWFLRDLLGQSWEVSVVNLISEFVLTKGPDEKLWELVQDLRTKLRSRRSQYWDLVSNACNSNRISDVVKAFILLFPKLLHNTPLGSAYDHRPVSSNDANQIIIFFQKKKLQFVNRQIFETMIWKYFMNFFTSMSVMIPQYFHSNPDNTHVIVGWMSKERAEHILNTTYRNFNRQAIGACVIRWSESRPGLIALAANVGGDLVNSKVGLSRKSTTRIRHYRIIVEVPDNKSEGFENIFRVNVGSGGSCKLFKTLNEVLQRMQITHVCVEDGFGLIKREDAFERQDLNAKIPIIKVKNVLEIDDSNTSDVSDFQPGNFERQATRAEGEMGLTINKDESSFRENSHFAEPGGMQGEADLVFFE